MPDNEPLLARECAVFARYLAGVEATPYLVNAYARGHAQMPAWRAGPPDRAERFLLAVARVHPTFTRIADGYARHVRPTGLLRQKLVLACAILESSPPAHDWLNTARTGSLPLTVLRIAGTGVASVLATLLGFLLLGPLHAVLALAARAGGEG